VHVYGTNGSPIATFTGYQMYGPQGQQVAFTAQTFDDGGPVKLAWDFNNDGTFGDDVGAGSPAYPYHTYATPGTKVVHLKVTDSDGASIIDTETVQINAPSPPPPPPT
jgi:PKD repeat protein